METTYLIDQLEQNKGVFLNLSKANSPEEYLWKPEPEKWCLLEIVCHLVDEEILDFRARVQTALDEQHFPMVPIDPVGWVESKNYLGQDYSSIVEKWIKERAQSITWLKSLQNPDWDSSFVHPKMGTLTARSFLANWLAHDQLHIRQINSLRRAYLVHISDEDLGYAGKW